MINGTQELTEKIEERYTARLIGMAPRSLSCFVEAFDLTEPPAEHHEFMCGYLEAIERRDCMRATFSMPPGHAKGATLDTPLPSPYGVLTVGSCQVGDMIFGSDGLPTKIIAKSEIFHKPCFRARTSDGEEIIVSDDHLWTLYRDRNARTPITLSTQEWYDRYTRSTEKRAFRLPKISPCVYSEKPLPCDPYLLGYWLGNGATGCGRLTCAEEDRSFVVGQFAARGFECTPEKRDEIFFQAYGFVKNLRAAGVLNNKHIPDIYLRASIPQRLALLRGLMDADGNCRDNGGARFVNADEALVDSVRLLLWELGVPNSKVIQKGGKVQDTGYIRSDVWTVSFSGIDCFVMPRKRAGLKNLKQRYSRYITFEPCPQQPTQCIAVDAPDELFLAGRGCIVTHNTKFCTRYFPAWYMGRNPRHRYLQGGHTQDFCESEFGAYVRDIMRNPLYARVFPESLLNPRSTASGNFKLNNGRGGYVTKGVGQKIAGFRGHCGGIDDAFGSREDADSPAKQVKTWNWFSADFSTRLLPGAPLFVVATRWNQEDLIAKIEKLNKDGKGIPWEIINLNGIIEDEYEAAMDPMGRDVGQALWGEYYTSDVLLSYKATLDDRDWWSLYKGMPRNQEGNVVKASWFSRYQVYPRNVRDTQGRLVERNVKKVTLSVDTANKVTKRSAYTAILVFIEDMDGRHYLVDVVRKKVEYQALKELIEATADKWKGKVGQCDAILVEDKGNGTSYIQDRRGKAPAPIIAIEPEQDGSKEFRFDAATPMIEGRQLLLPYNAAWMPDFIDELLTFPNSRYKDQTDALSQYLNRVRKRAGKLGTKRMRAGMSAQAA